MYWIWSTEADDEGDCRIYSRPDAIQANDLSFDDGVPMSGDLPMIEILIREDERGRLTDNLIAEGTTGLVLNSRLRSLLKQVGVDNLHYYPVELVDEVTAERNTDYELANILGAVSCIDAGQSDIEYGPDGAIHFIESLVLDASRIRGLLMFRLQEYLPIIVVHETVKERLEEAGISGVKFYRPEEYIL